MVEMNGASILNFMDTAYGRMCQYQTKPLEDLIHNFGGKAH